MGEGLGFTIFATVLPFKRCCVGIGKVPMYRPSSHSYRCIWGMPRSPQLPTTCTSFPMSPARQVASLDGSLGISLGVQHEDRQAEHARPHAREVLPGVSANTAWDEHAYHPKLSGRPGLVPSLCLDPQALRDRGARHRAPH